MLIYKWRSVSCVKGDSPIIVDTKIGTVPPLPGLSDRLVPFDQSLCSREAVCGRKFGAETPMET
jgi:hypothetical protein